MMILFGRISYLLSYNSKPLKNQYCIIATGKHSLELCMYILTRFIPTNQRGLETLHASVDH